MKDIEDEKVDRNKLKVERNGIRIKRILRTRDQARVYIPRHIIDNTVKFLREYGGNYCEGLLFWAGAEAPNCSAFITTAIYPQLSVASGAMASTESIDCAKMISEVRKRGLEILAQIHSHPWGIFHSNIDDDGALVYSEGFLSIVVPNYGALGMEPLSICGIYRYKRGWVKLTEQQVKNDFVIVDSVIDLRIEGGSA